MSKDIDIERMKEWFGEALMAADFDLRLKDMEKGKSWKEAPPRFLFSKMRGHVSKMMSPRVGQVHAIKVANYALMIATRLAGEKETVEVGPKKTIIREVIHPHAGRTESADVEWGPPIIVGEAEPDPIIETGLPPLDLGPLPNGPVKPQAGEPVKVESSIKELLDTPMGISVTPEEIESEGYYCPWCDHTAKLGAGCHGKICCIVCGKPINSRFADLLKKARQWDYVIMKEPLTSAKTAQHLGTSTSWAGKVLRELGWEQTRWHGAIWWRWNPPKEDGK